MLSLWVVLLVLVLLMAMAHEGLRGPDGWRGSSSDGDEDDFSEDEIVWFFDDDT